MPNLLIDELEGVGPVYGDKLRSIGIDTSEALLDFGSTAAGRRDLAWRTDVPEKRILGWVQLVDLCRIDGLAPDVAQLLGRSGARTVGDLAGHEPESLAERCAELNASRPVVRRAPTVRLVRNWIDEARALPKRIQY